MSDVHGIGALLFRSARSTGFGLAVALFAVAALHQVVAATCPALAWRHRWVGALHSVTGGAVLLLGLAGGVVIDGEPRTGNLRQVAEVVSMASLVVGSVLLWTRVAMRTGAASCSLRPVRLVAAFAAVAALGCIGSIWALDDTGRRPADSATVHVSGGD